MKNLLSHITKPYLSQARYFFVSLVFLQLLIETNCVIGVDVASPVQVSAFKCMKQQGANFAIVRAYRSFGAVDTNAVKTLTNAKSAGLITDIYMFPCRGIEPISQADSMLQKIPSNLYQKIWIDVQTNPSPKCDWGSFSTKSNCDFLVQIVSYLKKSKGKTVGIYASNYMWKSILGSTQACSELAGLTKELWYARYDGKAHFDDFVPFGGWTKPEIKQFEGDITWCGIDADKNYAA